MQLLEFLPRTDWFALALFFALWVGYAWFAKFWGRRQRSLLMMTNLYRRRWMEQALHRDPRMLDGIITQNLSHTPSFFSSTTILIIGGLVALLGTTDRAAEVVKDIPFSQQTSMELFEIKLLVLLGVFIYAFFRFTWSMRLYTFVALLIGAMPHAKEFDANGPELDAYLDRAARLVASAAETFNDGLRAYYFSFALLAWVVSTVALVAGTVLVVAVLYSREFRSDVVKVLRD